MRWLFILLAGKVTPLFASCPVAERVGFHEHQANELIFENDRLTGKIHEPVLGRTAKLETLNRLCDVHKVKPSDVLAVGDSANDIKMIEVAGLGVAFHGSDALKKKANAHVDHGKLTALLYFQGYSKSQFGTF